MADIELVQGEFGDSYQITIKDSTGANADISTYTAAKLVVTSKDLLTNKFTATLAISSPNVTWTMQSSETADLDGTYAGQVVLTKSGNTKRTKLLSIKAHKELPAT